MLPDRTRNALLVAATLLAAAGCARRAQIETPVASRPVVFSGFEVVFGPEINAGRRNLLARMRIPEEMGLALRQAYPAGPGPHVRVIITQFRAGRWGPTRMHAIVEVVGPEGQPLARVDADATSVAGSRNAKIQRVAQEIVNQIAQRL